MPGSPASGVRAGWMLAAGTGLTPATSPAVAEGSGDGVIPIGRVGEGGGSIGVGVGADRGVGRGEGEVAVGWTLAPCSVGVGLGSAPISR
ncbi:MAG: hypothetical protein JW900_03305, partial [Anaerolineae bacterium]|nr:hypothetical protein [Anaerolineae bacterium]